MARDDLKDPQGQKLTADRTIHVENNRVLREWMLSPQMEEDERIEWHRDSDGALVAYVVGYDDTNVGRAELVGQAPGSGLAATSALRVNDEGGVLKSNIYAEYTDSDGASRIVFNAGAKDGVLLDSDGASDLSEGVEEWIGLVFAPAAGALWASLDADHLCQYRKDPFGVVRCRGLAYPTSGYGYAGPNNVIGILPVGYRPTQNWHVATTRYDAGTATWYTGNFYVSEAGEIVVWNGAGHADNGAISNMWSLDPIAFFAD